MLRLTTLGTIDLRDRLGRPVREVLAQPKRIALLVHLALEGRRGPVPRDRILALFWPESDEPRARNALSQALYHLRQALGADVIVNHGAGLQLAPTACWCDAVVLEDALESGDLDVALDVNAGEFCPGLLVSGAGGVVDWIEETRRGHRRRLLAALRTRTARLAADGDAIAAAGLARRALALLPDDEGVVREYLALVARSGDVTGALTLFSMYASHLAATLEVDPAPETRALVEGWRRERANAAAASARPAPVTPAPEGTAPGPSTPVPFAPASDASARPALPPPRAPQVRRRVALLVGAVVLVLAGYTGRPGSAADPDAGAPRAIAVFPFTVRGGDAVTMLGDGMADLLAAKLDGTGEVRAIDPRSAVNAARRTTPDPQHGDALGRALGARYFVLGDIVERAGRIQMNGALYEVGREGRALSTASVTGDTAALFQLVDDLAGRLLATVLAGRDTSLTALAAVTTTSLPALKAYLRGERALRDGRDARAAAAFREAAVLDTGFALAQYRLALVANWIATPGADDPVEWASAAARHARRLTPLGRDLVEAFRVYKLPSSAAAPLYQAIVQAHPDNVEAWYMYGEALFHFGPARGGAPTDARAAFERVLALDPGNAHALVHLARIAGIEGKRDELREIVALHGTRHAEADRTVETRALLAWAQQDSAASAAIIAEARTSDPVVVFGLGQAAATYTVNLKDAERLFEILFDVGSGRIMRPYARVMLTEIGLARGHTRLAGPAADASAAQWLLESEVRMAVEPALGASPERLRRLHARVAASRDFRALGAPGRPLAPMLAMRAGPAVRSHLLALLELRLGDRGAARARLDTLSQWADSATAGIATRLAISLRADLLRAEGRTADALHELERYPFDYLPDRLGHDGARERFARAELLAALGRDAEALRWFSTFPSAYDLSLLAPSWLRQGQLLARMGRPVEARDRFARVLAIWADADADFEPVMRAARDGLATPAPRRLTARRSPPPSGPVPPASGGSTPPAPAGAR